jgi:hypothetical protein
VFLPDMNIQAVRAEAFDEWEPRRSARARRREEVHTHVVLASKDQKVNNRNCFFLSKMKIT